MLQKNPVSQSLLPAGASDVAPQLDSTPLPIVATASPGGAAVVVTAAPDLPDLDRSRHSLEAVLSDFVRHERNAIQTITKLGELYGTTSDRIKLEYVLPDGTTQVQLVPSYGYMLRELVRLQSTVSTLTGFGNSTQSASIMLADGSRRLLFTAESSVPVPAVAGLSIPTEFSVSQNLSVLDRLVQPLPELPIDLSPLNLSPLITQVQVRKLRLSTTADLFRTEFVGKAPVYDAAIDQLTDAAIAYSVQDEVIALEPAVPRFGGTFDVLGTVRSGVGSIVTDSLIYQLDTVLFRDLDLGSALQLQVGTELLVNQEPVTTRYRVIWLDAGTRQVQLERVSGQDTIKQGSAKLVVAPGVSSNRKLRVPIGPGQLLLVYLRPIRAFNNVTSPDWGTGLVVETDALKTPIGLSTTGSTLNSWAVNSLKDLGKALARTLGDGSPSLLEAKKPNVPTINLADFKVEQINVHLSATQSLEKIRTKLADRNRSKSELASLETTRTELKTILATNSFKSADEQKAAESALSQNQDLRTQKTSEYHSLVDDLAASTKDLSSFKPKYQVRGFWPFPSPTIGPDGKSQEIVQFIYRYRYLSPDGQGTGSQTRTYSTTDGRQVSGQFSEWTEVETKARLKSLPMDALSAASTVEVGSTDSASLVSSIAKPAELVSENPNDASQVNPNQLAIAISPGELVEIQVKSISEAGYPHAQSDWSPSVTIPFPDELKSPVETIQAESESEKARSQIMRDLEAMGVTDHLRDASTVGGQDYLHQAGSISTTFRTPENKPLTVDDVLRKHDLSIEQLIARLNGERGGRIQVRITNETGQVLDSVANQGTVSLLAGYYKDQVASQSIPKGEIITKLFYIEISNLAASDLALLSYAPGQYTEGVPVLDSADSMYAGPYVGYLTSRDEYRDYRRYWRTPLAFVSQTDNEDFRDYHGATDSPNWEMPGYQSSQMRGQVVYSRNHDLTLNNRLYSGEGVSADDQNLLPIFTGATQGTYVWNGGQNTVGAAIGNGRLSPFCVHLSHPDLQSGSDFMNDYANQFDMTTGLPTATLASDNSVNYPHFQHSKYFNLQATDPEGLYQLQYEPYVKAATGATAKNFPRRLGFVTNDKYLIGSNTCGSYLYLAPSDRKTLFVGGTSYQSSVVMKNGDPALRIPIVFQYRMTDFYGDGTQGTGLVGGFGLAAEPSNLVYAKKMGIDLVLGDSPLFSFDLRVEAQYKAKSVADVLTK